MYTFVYQQLHVCTSNKIALYLEVNHCGVWLF